MGNSALNIAIENPLPIAKGGTGAQTAQDALSALGGMANVTPGPDGNVITALGDAWVSSPSSGGSSVEIATFLLAVGTNLTEGADKVRVTLPYSGTILKAYADAQTAPLGADIIFDLNINGVTIWSTQSNRLKIVDGQTSGSQTAFDTTALVEGDILSIDVDQKGSNTAGRDIRVQMKIQI
jgi:hypothetical protein